ncbi:hypothetical protein B9479_002544 [Cryptococcus floricola]|uniref:5-oxoprolinase n=1 Tax=Cryptococcus floricola TaxID=2591691 RepID=A0A5D3B224_9TREE|nr:hypothetical protein B9479_002544 [Cryptococcus floricola]
MPVKTDIEPVEKIQICVDRGGTFCDVIARSASKGDHLVKLLSVDPANYPDAPREGVRRVLEWFTGETIPRDQPLDTSRIEYLRMGTTVATNALLERKGEKCALVITKGFKDALEIGTQTRPHLFQLAIKKPDVLYSKVVEISERVAPVWEDFGEGESTPETYLQAGSFVTGVNGAKLQLLEALDEDKAVTDLQSLYDEGYRSIAIALVHSYIYPEHELKIENIARSIGFEQISVSSSLQAMVNLVSRGGSATADAYLTPEVRRYADGFTKGFVGDLDGSNGCRVSFMQSDGALCDHRAFTGLKAILSGPAGGVVGFAKTTYDPLDGSPVVGFDMGGTSTDVSRFGGSYEHVFETTTAGVTIQTPQLDINTVAAGGGSILSYGNGLLAAGPESAGAHPGPACYRKGGPLTVTDANVFLGRIHIDSFPKIFGPTEDMPLDYNIVKQKFEELAATINKENNSQLTAAQVASGFINVANNSMARPIRALTDQRGFGASTHILASFGGAGGQSATALARVLGIPRVIVHKYSSLLSAYGMALADVAVDNSEPLNAVYGPEIKDTVEQRFAALKQTGLEQLLAQGIPESSINFERYLNLRYQGSDTRIMIQEPKDRDFASAFKVEHKREFAFNLDSPLLIENVRVRAVGKSEQEEQSSPFVKDLETLPEVAVAQDAHFATNEIYFETEDKFVTSPLYQLGSLSLGTVIKGPAVLLDKTQTILLHPGNTARILTNCVYVDVGLGPRKELDPTTVDPVQLSIFAHRFMGIAEQMGRALQKTAISLMIKERLDFSCAIFGPDGQLVANAPNVPVHLGSMQYAVQYQAEVRKGQLKPGDILISNNPRAGGTHLPDITVIQPVFEKGSTTDIVFWVASRGHHTDIGGLQGQSMHPEAVESWQEGASIMSTFLVRDGEFNIAEITKIFEAAGEYPNCLSARQLHINISDLKAQCSACAVGSAQIIDLFDEFGKDVVVQYMGAIRTTSELAVRAFFKEQGRKTLSAEDYLGRSFHDGSIIRLKIDIFDDGTAHFDYTGTTEESYSNLNAPPAVSRSAIIYSLRCLIGTDMPLNAGVLAPIKITIPDLSVLSPSHDAAVCNGNTETGQRVVDIIFKAFEACAASQGTMNVSGFDYKQYGYGETICGGAGAGHNWKGQSAVHINMTNTRIGDVELIEKAFPVLVTEFSIRRGTGGKGRNNGGDGVQRIYQARVDMRASLGGERRLTQPYGMHGGQPGTRGANYWLRQTATPGAPRRRIKLKPAAAFDIKAGDSVVINTPGGGGYGAPETDTTKVGKPHVESTNVIHTRANGSLAEYQNLQNEA